jgi:hypothetical protein
MDNRSVEPGPVALWARALAWIVVIAGCVAAGTAVFSVLRNGKLFDASWYQAAPFLLATIWLFPLFCIVAIRGRPPKYWPVLGTHHWQVDKSGRR